MKKSSSEKNGFVRVFHGMPKASYGKCIRSGCRSVSDLADGLCVKCWDRTSHKNKGSLESKDIRAKKVRSHKKDPRVRFRAEKTGNKAHTRNSAY